ncbi:DUF6538 domain-containing protein [Aureimonas altamirensis]
MAQPWLHPRQCLLVRRAVWASLGDALGKREELVSLDTKDAKLARVKYAEVSAEVEARWAKLQNGQRSLTEREAHAMARTAHDRWIEWHLDEPSEQFAWTPWRGPSLKNSANGLTAYRRHF